MYLLQQIQSGAKLETLNARESSRLSSRGSKRLTPAQEKRALFEAKLVGLIERRDPSADPSLGLTYRSEGFLRELKGKQAGLPYAEFYYGKPVDGQLKLDMARAMILGESRFVHFDRLALRVLTREIEKDWTYPQVYFDDKLLIPWAKFSEKYLIPFAKVDDPEVPESTELPETLMFTIHSSKPVRMSLDIDPASEEAVFSLQGSSKFKKYPRRLVDRLNGALRDYRTRVSWLKEYRAARVLPGLNADQLTAIRTELDPFYSKKPVLTELARGKFFDGSYIQFDNARTRGYSFRCESCSFPVALEIVSDYSFDRATDWNSDKLIRARVEEARVNMRLSFYHRERGCFHSVGRSNRTGETQIFA